ncbi:hypothetical protein L210DRAFT_3638925 [Boletus edulis BED1]|uniref:SUZ domain-containing protein n=1 Tax=Boletus edulis BED1 TaxID=1328754 RepID=A0AAD4GM67_BOLED|nr:hypothetical protein L210DRAFT_3638925 [Boletus edulis BED1]
MAKTNESNVWDQDPPVRALSPFARKAPRCLRLHFVDADVRVAVPMAVAGFVEQWTTWINAAKAKVVRDDWYDDDEDEEEEQEGDADEEKERRGDGNVKTNETPSEIREREAEEVSSNIWEEASHGIFTPSRVRTPMPELIVASASTSQSSPPPPPAALQPALRILKRPSTNANANNAGVVSSAPLTSSSPGPTSGSGSGSGVTSPAPRGTLAEREAQYQEARSRIFGEKESTSSGGVVIVRDPLGPASELEPGSKAQGPGRPAKGFGERQKGKKQ